MRLFHCAPQQIVAAGGELLFRVMVVARRFHYLLQVPWRPRAAFDGSYITDIVYDSQ